MGISLDHNIPDVVSDVEDVKHDIRVQIRKKVGRVMRSVWADAKQYVLDDPHTSGDLFSAIKQEVVNEADSVVFTVYTDASVAEYAAVVEYGSGIRRETAGPGARPFPAFDPDEQKPPSYPFRAPDIDNIEGFAYYIQEWMVEKGLEPRHGSLYAASIGIAKTIRRKGTYAHPFLRPAWFDNELKVKRAARNAIRSATR